MIAGDSGTHATTEEGRLLTETDAGSRTLVLPSWCVEMLRSCFDRVTSHVFRRTVAGVMDEAGLFSRAAADQLGTRSAAAMEAR